MAEPLKPCPFCGGKKQTWGRVRDGLSLNCNSCGVSFVAYHGPPGNTAEMRLISKWNARPEAAQVRVNLAIELQKAADAHCEGLSIPHDLGMVLERRIRAALEPDNPVERHAQKLRDLLEQASSAKIIKQPDTATGWQDIRTAPKGNKDVLVGWYSDHYEKFVWTRAGQVNGIWYVSGGTGTVCYPTHYFTLPPAPEKEG